MAQTENARQISNIKSLADFSVGPYGRAQRSKNNPLRIPQNSTILEILHFWHTNPAQRPDVQP